MGSVSERQYESGTRVGNDLDHTINGFKFVVGWLVLGKDPGNVQIGITLYLMWYDA